MYLLFLQFEEPLELFAYSGELGGFFAVLGRWGGRVGDAEVGDGRHGEFAQALAGEGVGGEGCGGCGSCWG